MSVLADSLKVMPAFLDEDVYFLGRVQPGVIDLALLPLADGKAALLFSAEAFAARHLGALPEGVQVQRAGDPRAKEELLRAALGRGATEIWLDTPPGAEAETRYPLRRALDYVLSFKRQSACL